MLSYFIKTFDISFECPELSPDDIPQQTQQPLPSESQSYPPQTNKNQSLISTLTSLICKEECNSFGLYTFTFKGNQSPRQPYALALYPKSVYFNHACLPNVGHFTDYRGMIVFYALKAFKKGEECLISYTALERICNRKDWLENEDDNLNLDKCDGMPLKGMRNMSIISINENRNNDNDNEKCQRKVRSDLFRKVFFFECECRRCLLEKSGDSEGLRMLVEEEEYHVCRKEGCRGWYVPEYLNEKCLGNGDVCVNVGGGEEFELVWKCIACLEIK